MKQIPTPSISRRSKILALFFALLTIPALALTSCSSSSSNDSSNQNSPSQSESSSESSSAAPTKIVALEYSFVDALLEVDVTPVGIADDNKKKSIEQLAGKNIDYTSVGQRKNPNIEKIAELKPQLILADTNRHTQIKDKLEKIAPTLMLNSREGSYQDILDQFTTITEKVGKGQEGKTVLAKHNKKIADTKTKLASHVKNKKMQLITARDSSITLHSSSSYSGSLMEVLGIKVAEQSSKAIEDGSLEQLSELNPDALFIAADSDNAITKQWTQDKNPVWDGMKANKQKQTYNVDRNEFTRFRGLKSAEYMASTFEKDLVSKS